MPAAKYNLYVEQGATFLLTVEIEGINMTGGSARMQFRRNYDDDHAAVSLTTDPGGGLTLTVLSTTQSILEIEISPSTTAVLDGGYRYDLEAVDASGVVRRLLEGKAIIGKEITK